MPANPRFCIQFLTFCAWRSFQYAMFNDQMFNNHIELMCTDNTDNPSAKYM